jgi:hypothetical protein
MSERPVLMTDEQAQILEDVGVELMRQQDDRAMKVLSLSLAYKFAAPIEPPLPSNVVQLDPYSRKVGA